jgi:hypothetical protein
MTLHGTNFELANKLAVNPRVVTLGPGMSQGVLTDFFYGYEQGNFDPPGERLTRKAFAERVRAGAIVCSAVYDGARLACVWGCEFGTDQDGVFTEVNFLFGSGLTDELLRALTMRTFLIARRHAQLHGRFRMRVHIGGRRGWWRRLKKIGCFVTAQGWIQEPEFNPATLH